MSEAGDRFRKQGLQLMVGGAVDLALVAGALHLWPVLNTIFAGQPNWALNIEEWVIGIVAVLGGYLLIGGSVLLLTAERRVFGR